MDPKSEAPVATAEQPSQNFTAFKFSPDTKVTSDPNAIFNSMPEGFNLAGIIKAQEQGHLADIDPNKTYIGPEEIKAINATPIEIPDEVVEPFNPKDPEYHVDDELKTQPLKLEDLLPKETTVDKQTITIGQEKPVVAASTENKFVNYIATATKKEGTEIAGREIIANDQFRIVREENGNYTVIYKDGLQAIALKNGNRMIVTVMQTGKGSRSEGATYNKYDIALQNSSVEEAVDDENQELRTRLTMGQRFGKMAHSILDPLFPYLESPETVSIDQKNEMPQPEQPKKSRFGWLNIFKK